MLFGGHRHDVHPQQRRRGLPGAGDWCARDQHRSGQAREGLVIKNETVILMRAIQRLRTRACRGARVSGLLQTDAVARHSCSRCVWPFWSFHELRPKRKPADPDRKYPLPTYDEDLAIPQQSQPPTPTRGDRFSTFR